MNKKDSDLSNIELIEILLKRIKALEEQNKALEDFYRRSL